MHKIYCSSICDEEILFVSQLSCEEKILKKVKPKKAREEQKIIIKLAKKNEWFQTLLLFKIITIKVGCTGVMRKNTQKNPIFPLS